ncbi:MAG: hypothetical protein MUO97_07690 [Dehalococcoidia bacterium]|nr:hypothetical protein [Dehalococcoidia bacterium]
MDKSREDIIAEIIALPIVLLALPLVLIFGVLWNIFVGIYNFIINWQVPWGRVERHG